MSAEHKITSAPHLCRYCSNEGLLRILAEHTDSEDAPMGDTSWRTWQLARCPTCSNVSVLFASGTDHVVEGILDQGENPEALLTDVIHPPPPRRPKGMPTPVAKALDAAERIRMLDRNGYAALVGRVIEKLCTDRQARGDSLFKKIEDLATREDIPSGLVEVAHGLRKLRNVGTHPDLGDLSDGEVDLLSDLCGAMLESVYTIPYLAKLATEGVSTEPVVGRTRKTRIRPEAIVECVARHYELSVKEMKSRTYSPHIVLPRQVAMYICRKLTDLSFPEIGRRFGGKHHSTVMYSFEKIERLRALDAELDRAIEQMIEYVSRVARRETKRPA